METFCLSSYDLCQDNNLEENIKECYECKKKDFLTSDLCSDCEYARKKSCTKYNKNKCIMSNGICFDCKNVILELLFNEYNKILEVLFRP